MKFSVKDLYLDILCILLFINALCMIFSNLGEDESSSYLETNLVYNNFTLSSSIIEYIDNPSNNSKIDFKIKSYIDNRITTKNQLVHNLVYGTDIYTNTAIENTNYINPLIKSQIDDYMENN